MSVVGGERNPFHVRGLAKNSQCLQTWVGVVRNEDPGGCMLIEHGGHVEIDFVSK